MRLTLLMGVAGLAIVNGCAVVYRYSDYEDGAGGQGGAPTTICKADSDCTVSEPECAAPNCNNGVCEIHPADANTPLQKQTLGDCKLRVCDGSGHVKLLHDDTDTQTDNNDCTKDACVDGEPAHPFVDEGVACGPAGTTHCDSSGHCVGCTSDKDCPQATECSSSHCNNGTCVPELQDVGTPCGVDICEDESTWSVSACDATGNCTATAQPCGDYLCAASGCRTSCSESSQCQPGLHCDNHVCSHCITCSEWLSGSVAARDAVFCMQAAELHNAVVNCMCRPGGGCSPNATCATAVCTGSQPVTDACNICVERCSSARECSMDL